MHSIIAGATGLIGKRLTEYWLQKKHSITVIGRSKEHIQHVFGERVQALTWEQLSQEVVASADVVVNLAGANVGEKRWTVARKEDILNSRLKATESLARLLAELGKKAPPLFNASAIGVYGLQTSLSDQLPPRLDENTSFDWKQAPDFLSEVGRRWEQAAGPALTAGVRVVFLRFAVVLAKGGGALPQIMAPFRFHMGSKLGSGNQPFSWVAIDDVIRAIDFLVHLADASGPFNIVSPMCVTEKTFAETLGHVLASPAWLNMPAFVLKALMGSEMARELLLEGQHVYPERLLEKGFHFAYPDLESALNHLLMR
jgi:uncharacterized protein